VDDRLVPMHATLRLHTRLFLNCFDEVSDEIARLRPNEDTSSMAYIALHMHDARHYLARLIGAEEPNPFEQITAAARSIDEIEIYPSLAEMRTAWLEITAALDRGFRELDSESLSQPPPTVDFPFPIEDETLLGSIAFLLHHEAYHIGQLALLRRIHRLPAMSFKV
jgi:uncharacterized damage-inducible protein DinB